MSVYAFVCACVVHAHFAEFAKCSTCVYVSVGANIIHSYAYGNMCSYVYTYIEMLVSMHIPT